MIRDGIKLTTYFGERDRVEGRFLADVLLDLYEEHALQTSVLLRGVEGFGPGQRLQTQRLLTLSEDLPLVSVAVDSRERIEALVGDVTAASDGVLVTLERARLLTGELTPPPLDGATKLTVYCGRQERVGGRPAYLALVELLHRGGVDGASVLLGVDGTAHGERERARFFARNAEVPLMVISVGDGGLIASLLPELAAMLERPLVTLERVQVLKRDGEHLADLPRLPDSDPAGLGLWQKLMVYGADHLELIRRLRERRAAGATALRGIWGYHGDHAPHGERFWALRREAPVLTVLVDTPEQIARSFEVVDEITSSAGLVTSEIVPAYWPSSSRPRSPA